MAINPDASDTDDNVDNRFPWARAGGPLFLLSRLARVPNLISKLSLPKPLGVLVMSISPRYDDDDDERDDFTFPSSFSLRSPRSR